MKDTVEPDSMDKLGNNDTSYKDPDLYGPLMQVASRQNRNQVTTGRFDDRPMNQRNKISTKKRFFALSEMESGEIM